MYHPWKMYFCDDCKKQVYVIKTHKQNPEHKANHAIALAKRAAKRAEHREHVQTKTIHSACRWCR